MLSKKSFLSLLFVSLFALTFIQAQVTIGSPNPPEKGAILQLKQFEPTTLNNQTTATKGLLLPRVQLIALGSLAPITLSTTNLTNYTGLTVYSIANTGTGIKEGVYTWNGSKWDLIVEK